MSMKFTSKNTLTRIFERLKLIFIKKSDIVDNLTSSDTDKPLSAKQGNILNTSVTSLKNVNQTKYVWFNTPGWYRIASAPVTGASQLSGVFGYACNLKIMNVFNSIQNAAYDISFVGAKDVSSFALLNRAIGTHIQMSKIRHTIDTANNIVYIEVYYKASTGNNSFIRLTDNVNQFSTFSLIEPKATEETVDNVTVVSSMELNA